MTSDEYIDSIRQRLKKNTTLYLVSEKASKERVYRLKNELEKESYSVEIKKCARCNNVWDIIITLNTKAVDNG